MTFEEYSDEDPHGFEKKLDEMLEKINPLPAAEALRMVARLLTEEARALDIESTNKQK